jgi:hypothetical protein
VIEVMTLGPSAGEDRLPHHLSGREVSGCWMMSTTPRRRKAGVIVKTDRLEISLIYRNTSRRDFALGATAVVAGTTVGRAWAAENIKTVGLKEQLKNLERDSGGRLGVSVLDTGSHARADHRGTERFPLCSTFKLLAAEPFCGKSIKVVKLWTGG